MEYTHKNIWGTILSSHKLKQDKRKEIFTVINWYA